MTVVTAAECSSIVFCKHASEGKNPPADNSTHLDELQFVVHVENVDEAVLAGGCEEGVSADGMRKVDAQNIGLVRFNGRFETPRLGIKHANIAQGVACGKILPLWAELDAAGRVSV